MAWECIERDGAHRDVRGEEDEFVLVAEGIGHCVALRLRAPRVDLHHIQLDVLQHGSVELCGPATPRVTICAFAPAPASAGLWEEYLE